MSENNNTELPSMSIVKLRSVVDLEIHRLELCVSMPTLRECEEAMQFLLAINPEVTE